MPPQKLEPRTDIPDLRALPLERLEELGGSVLGHSIELYLQRLTENSTRLNSFNSSI
jgi:FXSXX-COOH protein